MNTGNVKYISDILKEYANGHELLYKRLTNSGWSDWEILSDITKIDIFDINKVLFKIKGSDPVIPYNNATELTYAINKHGSVIVDNNNIHYVIASYDNNGIYLAVGSLINYNNLCENYHWTDGSPCGNKR